MAEIVLDLDRAPREWRGLVRRSVARALRSARRGMRLPLRFQGMGMTAVVFCDAAGRGYKIGHTRLQGDVLAREAEFLRIVGSDPEVSRHVAQLERFDPSVPMIVRECVREDGGQAYRHGLRNERYEVWNRIRTVATRYGFGPPEYKDDSFRYVRGRGWVLVDAGFAFASGRRLIGQVLRAIRSDIAELADVSDLAFAVRTEAGRSIDRTLAADLDRRLNVRLDTLRAEETRRRSRSR